VSVYIHLKSKLAFESHVLSIPPTYPDSGGFWIRWLSLDS